MREDAWGEGEERSSSSHHHHHHANSRCDKVTACKHQSNLNLAYHLPRAVCGSFPSPFGVPNASEQGPRATRRRIRGLSSCRCEMIDRLGVMRAPLVPLQVAAVAVKPTAPSARSPQMQRETPSNPFKNKRLHLRFRCSEK